MKKQKENEELQSRREFFKEAAKKALPVIGAIALASSPIIAQAAEKTVMSCNYGCSNSCSGGCSSSCIGSCKGGCTGCSLSCQGNCKGGCQGCSNTCRTSVNHH